VKYFNRKEEVIDIQLTQYGKHLLSEGRLRPSYYAFFDDDVLYDGEYAGLTENSKDISDRIKETPRLKTQYIFQSAEKNILEARNFIQSEKQQGRETRISLQPTAERHYALSLPIGTAGLGNEFMPSWELTSFKTPISASKDYEFLHGNSQTQTKKSSQKIPQLEFDITHETIAAKQGNYENKIEFSDGTVLGIKDDYLFIEVLEQNSVTLTEDFQIEVFKFEDEFNSSGLKVGEKLIPLEFRKSNKDSFKKYFIDENNILVENKSISEAAFEQELFAEVRDLSDEVDLEPNMVEYYFNILTDESVPNPIVCQHRPIDRTKNLYAREMYRCDETTTSERVDIYEDAIESDFECD
jgi:hypothetical protein